MTLKLEICVGSLESALAAQKGGADRIELCDNLGVGGTTPSYGMIRTCKSLLDIPVFPIIRPRGGNFVYSDQEFQVMREDVTCCAELGCEGIVFGILKDNGDIDTERCSELIALAGQMEVTFHRAFDRCSDLEKGLENIIKLGCKRILTSGGANFAEEATPTLKALVTQASGRISIMPGSGITSLNILEIASQTGAIEFHTTAKKRLDMNVKQFGLDISPHSYSYETDSEIVANIRRILQLI